MSGLPLQYSARISIQMNERLALGTVQFGLAYGIANQTGRVGLDEARRILSMAWSSGISTLDTAIAYGDSEQNLGEVGIDQWSIVSKLPAIPDFIVDANGWALEQIVGSLKRLGVAQLDAVLLHRPDQLFERQGHQLLAALQQMKSQRLVKKIGVSVYAPSDLDRIFDTFHFDVVQAPLNILDRRLVESGWTEKLKKLGVELHVRSAFLQGLLLMPASQRPQKFSRWAPIWTEWHRWLESECVTPLEACLRYVLSVPDVDKIVVGVDRVDQLMEILDAAAGELLSLPKWPQVIETNLINPALWDQL